MKLLVKTSLYYLLCSIPILLIVAVINYFTLSFVLKESNEEYFKKRKSIVENYFTQHDSVGLHYFLKSGDAKLNPVSNNYNQKDYYCDTLVFDKFENDLADVQMLKTVIKTDKGKFSLQLWRSTVDNDELVSNIISSQLLIFIFLFLIMIGVNWWLSNKLWKPFYSTIKSIQSFQANTKEKPMLQISSIKEFKELNFAIGNMMEKMIRDFKAQKQFTENASHETQTPLAVIKAKIELLLQSDNLGKTETDYIATINNAATKLSRLNKSLLLLTKIENQQFKVQKNIPIDQIIKESIVLFQTHLEEKNITLLETYSLEKKLNINPDLCLVLINTILLNAIVHNVQNGIIEINLNEKQITFSNTGQTQPLNSNKIFERFNKNSSSNESLGLGLAIAKEIATTNGLILSYKYESKRHCFCIEF